jgi:RNA polymerase sigma factor (sigma-70 family)
MYLKLIEIEQTKGNLNHLCPDGKPNVTWCYAVLRNAHISTIRKNKPAGALSEAEPYQDTSEAAKERERLLNSLWQAISNLNKHAATSYECRYFLYYVGSGKSLRQIAKENNTTVWVVSGAIRNAKQRLMDIINE